MDHKQQIADNVKAMHQIAQRTQAAVDAVIPGNNDRRRGPGRPPGPRVLDHMTSPNHTTSFVFMVSVPISEAVRANAHLAWLLSVYRDFSKSEIVLQALEDLAISCGFEWDPDNTVK